MRSVKGGHGWFDMLHHHDDLRSYALDPDPDAALCERPAAATGMEAGNDDQSPPPAWLAGSYNTLMQELVQHTRNALRVSKDLDNTLYESLVTAAQKSQDYQDYDRRRNEFLPVPFLPRGVAFPRVPDSSYPAVGRMPDDPANLNKTPASIPNPVLFPTEAPPSYDGDQTEVYATRARRIECIAGTTTWNIMRSKPNLKDLNGNVVDTTDYTTIQRRIVQELMSEWYDHVWDHGTGTPRHAPGSMYHDPHARYGVPTFHFIDGQNQFRVFKDQYSLREFRTHDLGGGAVPQNNFNPCKIQPDLAGYVRFDEWAAYPGPYAWNAKWRKDMATAGGNPNARLADMPAPPGYPTPRPELRSAGPGDVRYVRRDNARTRPGPSQPDNSPGNYQSGLSQMDGGGGPPPYPARPAPVPHRTKPNTDRYPLVARTNGKIDFAVTPGQAAREYARRLTEQYSRNGIAGEMTDQAVLRLRSDFDVFRRSIENQPGVIVMGRPEPQVDTQALATSWRARARLLADARALSNEQKVTLMSMLAELRHAGPANVVTYRRIRAAFDDYVAGQAKRQRQLDDVVRLKTPLANVNRRAMDRINAWLTAQALKRNLKQALNRTAWRATDPQPNPLAQQRDGFWKTWNAATNKWERVHNTNHPEVERIVREFEDFADRKGRYKNPPFLPPTRDEAWWYARYENLRRIFVDSYRTEPMQIPPPRAVAASAAEGHADLDASKYEPTGFLLQPDGFDCLHTVGRNGMPEFLPDGKTSADPNRQHEQRRGVVVITIKHTLFAKIFHPFTKAWKARNNPAYLAQDIPGSAAGSTAPQEPKDYDDFMRLIRPFRLAGTRVMMIVTHVPYWVDAVDDDTPDSELRGADLMPQGGVALKRWRKVPCGISRIDSTRELPRRRDNVPCPRNPAGLTPQQRMGYNHPDVMERSGHECDETVLPPGAARDQVRAYQGRYIHTIYARKDKEEMIIWMDPAELPVVNPNPMNDGPSVGGGGAWDPMELRRKVQDTVLNLLPAGLVPPGVASQELYQRITHTMGAEDDDPAAWQHSLPAVGLPDDNQPIVCTYDSMHPGGNHRSAFNPHPNYPPYHGHTFSEEDDVISSLVMHELNNQSSASWNHNGARAMARFHGYSKDLGYFKSLAELDYFDKAMKFVGGPNWRPGAANDSDTRGCPAPFYSCHLYWLDAFMHGPEAAREEFPNSVHWERYDMERQDAGMSAIQKDATARAAAGGADADAAAAAGAAAAASYLADAEADPEFYARVADSRIANQIRAKQIRALWKLLNMLVARDYVLPQMPQRAKSEGSTSAPPPQRQISAPAKLASQPWINADDVPADVFEVVFDHYLADEKYDVTTPDYVRIYALDAIARRVWANVAKLARDDRPWRTMDDVPLFFHLNVERRTQRALLDLSILGAKETRAFIPAVYPPARWKLYTDVNLTLDCELVDSRYFQLLQDASPEGLAQPLTDADKTALLDRAARQMWDELYGAGGIFADKLKEVPPAELWNQQAEAMANEIIASVWDYIAGLAA